MAPVRAERAMRRTAARSRRAVAPRAKNAEPFQTTAGMLVLLTRNKSSRPHLFDKGVQYLVQVPLEAPQRRARARVLLHPDDRS